MKGRIKKNLVNNNGDRIKKGTEIIILESRWVHTIEIKEGGITRYANIDTEFVFLECEVPDCKLEATSDSPKFWCDKHFKMWLNFDDDVEPDWMKFEKNSKINHSIIQSRHFQSTQIRHQVRCCPVRR